LPIVRRVSGKVFQGDVVPPSAPPNRRVKCLFPGTFSLKTPFLEPAGPKVAFEDSV
jgi:hypothetical protein